MAKKIESYGELVESHKPKNFKYKYIFHDDEVLKALETEQYDISSLDTIVNDELVNQALQSTVFTTYERETVARAKEPTILENGVIISKRMVTKADKKLKGVHVGPFTYNGTQYIAVKLEYEKFEILEIFILI